MAVERVDKYAFSCNNIGQIIHSNCHGGVEALYFKAKVSDITITETLNFLTLLHLLHYFFIYVLVLS